MIRKSTEQDTDEIMSIWLSANISAHGFIPAEYWERNYDDVRKAIKDAEVYVYDDEKQICGFIGLDGSYIAGLFVAQEFRSQGIGSRLMDYAKSIKNTLCLNVYSENRKAVDFYIAGGFKIDCESTDQVTGSNEYAMSWEKQKC